MSSERERLKFFLIHHQVIVEPFCKYFLNY
nr:MAG TPA: hypothetical protein [Caudoviricetes sp.]